MSFLHSEQDNEREFDNADSFAMAFDNAWKNLNSNKQNKPKTKEEKLKSVYEVIKNHPFMRSSPSKAQDVIKFRVRLLNLN